MPNTSEFENNENYAMFKKKASLSISVESGNYDAMNGCDENENSTVGLSWSNNSKLKIDLDADSGRRSDNSNQNFNDIIDKVSLIVGIYFFIRFTGQIFAI